MKVVLQKVSKASVSVEGKIIGQIGKGYVLLVGFGADDLLDQSLETENNLDYVVNKISNLRVFEDENDKINLSIHDVVNNGNSASILSISQFTLYANTKKGNRPSFIEAAPPEIAQQLYQKFNQKLTAQGLKVETGEFGAHMEVELVNDGPVTIIFDTEK